MGPRDCWVGLAVGLIVFIAFAPCARAATGIQRYVAQGGVDAGGCSDATAPCGTIQYAVDQAGLGDTVHIAAGTYVETVNWKDGRLQNLPSGASIVGAGPGKTIVNGPEPCGAGAGANGTFFVGGTDVSLRALSVGCSNTGVQAFGSVEIEAVEFLATSYMNLDSGYGPLRVSDSTFHGRIGIGSRGADLTVVGSTFETSQLAVVAAAPAPRLRLTANRFLGEGVAVSFSPGVLDGTPFRVIDLDDNWWGCNDGPGAIGCATIEGLEVGAPLPSSWLQLQPISPPTALSAGTSAELTFGLVGSGTTALAAAFPPVSVRFATESGTLEPGDATLVNGVVTTTFRAPGTQGIYRLAASLDKGTAVVTFNAPTPTPSPTQGSPAPTTPLPPPPLPTAPASDSPPGAPMDRAFLIELLVLLVAGVILVMSAAC